MAIEFESDPAKPRGNFRKHAVSFEEAATVFGDPLSVTIGDPLHSTDEQRFIIVGRSRQGRIIVVVHVDREHRIRIISARLANAAREKEV